MLYLFLISFEKTRNDSNDSNSFDSNEEYVSYDVDSLFISIPLGETIDFILD